MRTVRASVETTMVPAIRYENLLPSPLFARTLFMFATRSSAKSPIASFSPAKEDAVRTHDAADASNANRTSTTFVSVSPMSMFLPSTRGSPVREDTRADF